MWLKGAETGHKWAKIHTPIFIFQKMIFTPFIHQSSVEIRGFMKGYVKCPVIIKTQEMQKNKDLQTYDMLCEVHKIPIHSFKTVRIDGISERM